MYTGWKSSEFLEGIELYGIQLPGRETRFRDTRLTDAVEAGKRVAAAMLPLIDKPYALFGHSMGALLAYETAHALAALGAPSPVALIVSARRAPQIPLRRPAAWNLSEKDFSLELRRLQGTPEEVLASPELMQLLGPQLRADFQMEETYIQPTGRSLLTCRVAGFRGLRDKDVTEQDLVAWQAVTSAEWSLEHALDDGHFYIHSHTWELIRRIRSLLDRGTNLASFGSAIRVCLFMIALIISARFVQGAYGV